jgi:hypothetical protein
VNDLSPTEVVIYDGLIEKMEAEEALKDGGATPETIGRATELVTGSKMKGAVALAQAQLAEAALREGF